MSPKETEMSQDLDKFFSSRFNYKSANDHLDSMQKLKLFAESKLSDLSNKPEEERVKGYFDTLLAIRDFITSELAEHAFLTSVNKSIEDYRQKLESEARDVETFKQLLNENPKKNDDPV